MRENEMFVRDLGPEQIERLVHVFQYERRGPFVLAILSPDEAPVAVWGDWNGDGEGYWESCAHCFLPIMERAGHPL